MTSLLGVDGEIAVGHVASENTHARSLYVLPIERVGPQALGVGPYIKVDDPAPQID